MLIVPRAGSVVTLGMSDGWSRRPGELGAFLGGLPTSLAPAAQLLHHTARTRNQYPSTARPPPPQPGRESRRSYRYRATTHFTDKTNLVWPQATALAPPVSGVGVDTGPGPRPRQAAAPCCSPVLAVPAGAARQPRAALAAGDRRGEVTKNIWAREMARDGVGGAAGTLHHAATSQGSSGHWLYYTLFTIREKWKEDNIDISTPKNMIQYFLNVVIKRINWTTKSSQNTKWRTLLYIAHIHLFSYYDFSITITITVQV